MSSDCQCLLNNQREVRYFGNQKAEIIFVGESPGHTEIREGKPFVGVSGRLLRDCAHRAGILWDSIMVLNSARCILDKDTLGAKGIKSVLDSCRPNIEAAINHIKPKGIVVLGDVALQQVMKKKGITKKRGKWLWSEEFNCWVMPAFHPSYCLRNRAMIPVLIEDLTRVRELQDNYWKKETHTQETRYIELTKKEHFKLIREGFKGEIVGFDTETEGKDWMDPNCLLICATLSHKNGTGVMIRLHKECSVEEADFTIWVNRAKKGSKKQPLTEVGIRRLPWFEEALDCILGILADETISKVMCNGNFDQHFIARLAEKHKQDYVIKNYVMDVQAAAHVLDENRWTMADQESLQFAYTDVREDYNSQFNQKYRKDDMLSVPIKDLLPYSTADADVCRQIALSLAKELKEPDNERQLNYFRNFVQPVVSTVLYELETNGTRVDRDALPLAKEETAKQLSDLAKECFEAMPPLIKALHKDKGLSLSRDALIRDVLFHPEGFNLRSTKQTPTKQASVDKETLNNLMDQKGTKRAHRFLEAFQQWKELHKLYSTYLNGFEAAIKIDGRIHAQYSLVMARTGRSSCSKPALQTIPKRSKSAKIVRRLLIATSGFRLLTLDAAQSELRWAAHVAEDKAMAQVFLEGRDIHTETASALAGSPIDDMEKELRDKYRFNAKCSNFGMLYGMGARNFVRYAKKDYGLIITQAEAQTWIDTWFGKYPGIKQYHQKTFALCSRLGYVESPLGRRRRLPEINSSDPYEVDRALKQAVNHRIQSASSDTPLLAAYVLLSEGLLDPKECQLINFVHDELVYQVKDEDSIVDRYYRLIKQVMENPPLEQFGVKLKVPLVSDGKQGYNLAEMHAI